jgi:TatD DNase family protein
VNGIATFVKDPVQLEVYQQVPLQKLLLETDAPFLTPTPYRGRINEPKQVERIATFLSELRHESQKELAAATTRNSQQLFGV